MWFLWATLILSTAVIIVHYKFKDNFIIYIIGFFVTLCLPDTIYLPIRMYTWLYPFFVGAYLTGKYKQKLDRVIEMLKKPAAIITIFAVHFVLVCFWKHDYYIYSSINGIGISIIGQTNMLRYIIALIYRIVAGTLGSLLYILLADAAVCKFHVNWQCKPILFCSKYSIGIYIFSVYFLNNILCHITFLYKNLLLTIIETITILFISIFVMRIIDMIPILRKLFLGGR